MEIVQLQMVKLILETGSFYNTAVRLNCAQSVVSRQIAALEHECGGRFFDRNARSVRLTDFGERMLPHIETILAAAGQMIGQGERPPGELTEEVRIAIGPQLLTQLSGSLYNELKRAHPNIRLSISEALRDRIRADLKEGRTDIAVFMRSGPAFSHDDRIICPAETCLVGLPDSPATAKGTIAFANLAGLPLLLPSHPSEWRSVLEAAAARKKIALSVVAETNASGPRAALVEEGAGYLIVPTLPGPVPDKLSWLASGHHAKRLRASRIVDPVLPLNLVVSVGEKRSQAVRLVTQILERMLRDLLKESLAPT